MRTLFIITISILYSSIALAKPTYQIDLIIFAHPQSGDKNGGLNSNSPLLPTPTDAITLTSGTNSQTYHLLPAAQSALANEYYLLSRRSNYVVLGHYSWRQAANSRAKVTLPQIDQKGWQVQGTVQVRQGTYYSLDTHLQCSSPVNPESFFTLTQKQRLKGNVVYYLDHPQIGMLVKIHQMA